MNIRAAALSLALGLFTSASAFAQSAPCAHPGYAQPGYVQPAVGRPVYPTPVVAQPVVTPPAYGRTVYTQPAPQPVVITQPAYGRPVGAQYAMMGFANSLRSRLAQAEQQLRLGVARGAVTPQAIVVFNNERAQIEATLGRATRDGFLAPVEQARLDRMTARLERIDEQFRTPVYAQGYGRRRAWH